MCSKVNHIFSDFFSTISYHKLLVTLPCARQQILVVYLFYVVCICYSHTLNLSLPIFFFPFDKHVYFLCLRGYFCFIYRCVCTIFFSDSTYKWFHIISFVWLTSQSMILRKFTHVVANDYTHTDTHTHTHICLLHYLKIFSPILQGVFLFYLWFPLLCKSF